MCVCPWHTMWHLMGLWGCWWEQKTPSGRHWAITGRHVARAHLYVEMPVSRLDMELSPSILEATSQNLVQSKADIKLRSMGPKKVFDRFGAKGVFFPGLLKCDVGHTIGRIVNGGWA